MATMEHPTPRIGPSVFYGIQWFLAGITLILLGFRLYVRISSYRRIWIDDGLVIAAWLMFVANNILWHTQLNTTFLLFDLLTAQALPTLDGLKAIVNLLRATSAFQVLFFCSLWSIKFSFLMFFRRLGDRMTSKSIKIWWWIVTVITTVGLIVCLATGQYKCSTGDSTFLISYCGTDASKAEQTRITRIATSMDVITDAFIISIPFTMLWFTHLPIRKKLGLIGIFSLSILIIIFALIRLLVLPNENIAIDLSWSFMWNNIEMGVAIMVACLGAFRQLYVNKQDKSSGKGYSGSSSRSYRSWRPFRYFRGRLFRSSDKSSPRETKTVSSGDSSTPSGGQQARFNTRQDRFDSVPDSTLRDTVDTSSMTSRHQYWETQPSPPLKSQPWGMERSVFLDADHVAERDVVRSRDRRDTLDSFEMVSPISMDRDRERSMEKIV